MQFKIPRELQAAYPYQFAGPNIGLAVNRGWFGLFAQLCADIDAVLGENKHGFHWVQVKQKFGAARWYWELNQSDVEASESEPITIEKMPDRANGVLSLQIVGHSSDPAREKLLQRIRTLVTDAEDRTNETCIACGEPGKLDATTTYVLVVCPKHAKQRRGGAQLKTWFDDDEDFQ